MAKVLIVDDDEMMRKLYEKAFVFAGHEVLVASNGKEGWERACEGLPEVVLLDIMMPEMSGMGVLEKFQADEKLKQVPVIMLTNVVSGTLEAAVEATKKGAVGYIIKSKKDPKEIVEMVEKVMAGEKVEIMRE